MLDRIDQCTHDIKMILIQLGFELPPPTRLHNHKLKQVQHDLKEIAAILSVEPSNVFNDAQQIFFICTGKWHAIHNLNDLHIASNQTRKYLSRYFSRKYS